MQIYLYEYECAECGAEFVGNENVQGCEECNSRNITGQRREYPEENKAP